MCFCLHLVTFSKSTTMQSFKHIHKQSQGRSQTGLTPNGSAFSQERWEPQLVGLIFSGSDSGMATMMKSRSRTAMAVARATTRLSPYTLPRWAPIAGLVTRLAANVADTCQNRYKKDACDALSGQEITSCFRRMANIMALTGFLSVASSKLDAW